MSMIWFELKLAWRGLLRTPGFALTAASMLCAGLATCLYMFGAIQSLMLRPLPLPEPDRLLHVEFAVTADSDLNVEIPQHTFYDLERGQSRFEALGGFSTGTINLSDEATRAERYDGSFITGSAFEAWGVPAMLGRTLHTGDELSGAAPVVLIGYQLWQQRYNAADDIIGRLIRVNGQPTEVIGVMPNGFRFPFDNEVWVPRSRDLTGTPRGEDPTLEVFGRLRAEATPAEATAEISALVSRIKQDFPATTASDRVDIKPYHEEFINEQTRQVLWTMFAAVVLVLLIACANVANLLFARGAARSRDVAVRSSLGATRWRLALGMIAESLILALLATPVAIVLANWGGRLTMEFLRSSDGPPPFWMTEWHFDVGFAAVAIGLALLAGVIAGLLPGLRLARDSTAQVIRDGSASLTSSTAGHVLVVAEIAMSVALLVATGLTVRGIINLERTDFGVRTEGILTARYGLFESAAADDDAMIAHQQRVLQEVSALPGVEAATLTTALPMANTGSTSYYVPEGMQIDDPLKSPAGYDVRVDIDFFRVFELALQEGRAFDARDHAEAPAVAIVSRSLAERHWPGESALGKRLRMERADNVEAPWVSVIGVVGDVIYDGRGVTNRRVSERPGIYRPLQQAPSRFVSIVMAGAGGTMPEDLAEPLRATMRRVDSDTPLYWVRPLQWWVDTASRDHRLVGTIFSLFGVFSLLLACAGLYAVMAFSVTQRTREIGVRRALGAHAEDVLKLVVGQGARQVGLGLLLGLPLALGFGFALRGVLYQVSSADPLTYASVLLLFALTAGLAALLPGRRALRVEPIEALRHA